MSLRSEARRPGLRERKKAKTRAAIQAAALRLFREQGYAQTTVEQVADAAEVSPSTFFRYFPTKEDVVFHDRYDPLLLAAFREQPPEVDLIDALRVALADVFGSLSEEERAQEQERAQLLRSVPELQARALDHVLASAELLAAAVAARTGRAADDPEVWNFTGALIGVGLASMLAAGGGFDGEYVRRFDAALEHLKRGLPLD